jgi:hypothetical protein
MKIFKVGTSIAIVSSLLLITGIFGQAKSIVQMKDLKWLAGNWEYTSPDKKSTIYEHWTEPANLMLGLGSTVKSGRVSSYEYLRIFMDGDSIVYAAKPSNSKGETLFKLTLFEKNQVVFENPEHDFPKKIKYTKISDREIEVQVTGGAGKGFGYRMKKQ